MQLIASVALLLPAAQQIPGASFQFAAPIPAPRFEQVDLFSSGDGFSHTYRIPALAVANSGVLIAICDARRDNSSDLPGNIDIVLRRSFDGGATWLSRQVIQDFPQGIGAGDPSVLVDRMTGRIYCFYAYAPPGVGFFSSQPGSNSTTDPNTLHAHIVWSDDDGASWSAERDLNPEIKDPAWAGIFASSGTGFQLASGRLLQPYAVREASGTVSARNAYSDDHGVTWQMGAAAGFDVNESKVLELPSGLVLQNMRHNAVRARFMALSMDGGVSFGPAFQAQSLIDPRVNAGFGVFRSTALGDAADILMFSNPWSVAGRVDMTVRLSEDLGRTWPSSRLVHPGPSAYSTLERLPNGDIGLFYERGTGGAYEQVTFARFNREWIDDRPPILGPQGRPNPDHPDLWAWFDASDQATVGGAGAVVDGDPVARWDDRSSAGVHDLARSSDGPATYRAMHSHGLPAVAMLGDSDLWGATSGVSDFGNPGAAFTLVMVARIDNFSGVTYLFDKTTGAGGFGLRMANGLWEVHAERLSGGPAVDTVLRSAPLGNGGWQVHTLRIDGDAVEHWIDGALAVSGAVPSGGVSLGQGGLLLGANFMTEQDSFSSFSEIVAYRRALTLPEQSALEQALIGRYGL